MCVCVCVCACVCVCVRASVRLVARLLHVYNITHPPTTNIQSRGFCCDDCCPVLSTSVRHPTRKSWDSYVYTKLFTAHPGRILEFRVPPITCTCRLIYSQPTQAYNGYNVCVCVTGRPVHPQCPRSHHRQFPTVPESVPLPVPHCPWLHRPIGLEEDVRGSLVKNKNST